MTASSEQLCQNYTYLLSEKETCYQYAKTIPDRICGDASLQQVYPEVCSGIGASNSGGLTLDWSQLNWEKSFSELAWKWRLWILLALVVLPLIIYYLKRKKQLKSTTSLAIIFDPERASEINWESFLRKIQALAAPVSWQISNQNEKVQLYLISSEPVSHQLQRYLSGIKGLSWQKTPSLQPSINKPFQLIFNPKEFTEVQLKPVLTDLINYFCSISSASTMQVNLWPDLSGFAVEVKIYAELEISTGLAGIYQSSGFQKVKISSVSWRIWQKPLQLTAEQFSQWWQPEQIYRGSYPVKLIQQLEASPNLTHGNELAIGETVLADKAETVYLPKANLQRHVYLAGKTGMGKSTVMTRLYQELSSDPKLALLMLDPHGANLVEIARQQSNWERLVYFNLGREPEQVFTFNPLFSWQTSLKDKENQVEQLLEIIRQEAQLRRQELGTSMEKTLNFLLQTGVHFADAYYRYLTTQLKLTTTEATEKVNQKQLTFPDLSYLLRPNYKYLGAIQEIFSCYPEPIGHSWQKDLAQHTQPVVLDGVENRLKYVVRDSLQYIFEGNRFQVSNLIAHQAQLLLPLTEQSFGPESKRLIAKFMLSQIWQQAQKIDQASQRPETIIFIDEFQEAQLPLVDDLLSQARKYKISLVLANQYLNQLKLNIQQSILGNVSTIFTFNIGNLTEAKLLTPLFGNRLQATDLINLPPYRAYLRTLEPTTQTTALLTFQTKPTTKQYQHNLDDLDCLNKQSLQKYGQPISYLKEIRNQKLTNAEKYFLY